MNIKVMVLATILGISAPAITDIAVSHQAVASTRFRYPTGGFTNAEWKVNLSYNDDGYNYRAKNMKNGSSLALSGAKTSGDRERQIYTWYNGKYSYQVVWRPTDPDTIRLQVFAPNGREILNSLLRSGR